MNFFEMIAFVISIALGVVVATKGYALGGAWVAIPAFAAGFFVLPMLFILVTKYDEWAYPGAQFCPNVIAAVLIFITRA
jgi:hypothetical protein